MSEQLFANGSQTIEAEIAELSRQIEAKKRILEQERHIVPEGRVLVGEALAEHFYPPAVSSASAPTFNQTSAVAVAAHQAAPDYLDTLDSDTIQVLNTYITKVGQDGIRKTLAQLRSDHPYILDAFHDTLITRLYHELQERGLIKP